MWGPFWPSLCLGLFPSSLRAQHREVLGRHLCAPALRLPSAWDALPPVPASPLPSPPQAPQPPQCLPGCRGARASPHTLPRSLMLVTQSPGGHSLSPSAGLGWRLAENGAWPFRSVRAPRRESGTVIVNKYFSRESLMIPVIITSPSVS